MSDMAIDYKPRPFTVDEYHRLADVGVLRDDERVELLDGIIAEMSPIGPPHVGRHARVVHYLFEALGDRASVVGQGSFSMSPDSEPQTDVAIAASGYDPLERPLIAGDLLAVIEIARSSLQKDTGPKLRIYARCGIRDYLVVDLEHDQLVHFSEPHELGYRREARPGYGETFTLERLSGITFADDDFREPRNPKAVTWPQKATAAPLIRAPAVCVRRNLAPRRPRLDHGLPMSFSAIVLAHRRAAIRVAGRQDPDAADRKSIL